MAWADEAGESAPRGPLMVNASDLKEVFQKGGLLPRNEFHGEHGSVDDPDIFQPVAVGVTTRFPKLSVRADPDGAMLNTATTRTELGVDELNKLIDALTEARDYLDVHGKDRS